MNKSIKYNIKLNIKTLKTIFQYFNMNENNTIIELVTKNKYVIKNLDEFKSNIIEVKDSSIYLKKLKFDKLFYFLSKNSIFDIYYYKSKSIANLTHKLKDNNCEVSIHTKLDKIYEICFDTNHYNYDIIKSDLKKFKSINYELIIIIIIIVIGVLIRLINF